MSEIFLKCEVSGCTFLTPKLSSEFYGDMVEHLKVHHLSCHTVTASRNATATSTSPAVVSVLPKEEVRSDAGETGGLKLPDVNMNNDIKVFKCPEPGCLFKTDYQSNMVRHKRNKHKRKYVSINEEEQNGEEEQQKFPSPLHTSTPLVKTGRLNVSEANVVEESSVKKSKKRRADEGFYCFNCLNSFSNIEELNMHIELCCRQKDEEQRATELKRMKVVARSLKMEVADQKGLGGKKEDASPEVSAAGETLKEELGSSVCPNCHLDLRSVSALNKHWKLCLKRSKKFVCRTCNKAYLYARGLQRHQKFCKKGRKLDDDSSNDEEESEYEEEVDENVATCQECEMSFASAAGLAVHHQHCNKKVVYDEVRLNGQAEVEGNNGKKTKSRSLLLVQTKSECLECGKTFTSNNALALHKRFFGENCKKTARGGNNTNIGQGERNSSEESGVDAKKIGLDNSYLTEKRNTVSAAEEETQKTAGEDDVIKENDIEAVNKVETGKGIKEKEEQYPVTKDCQKETSTEAKVKMLVDYLSLDGKPFKINLTLPRDCIMQKVLIKIAENFKTGLDELSFSRNGIELTGEEKAVDYEGEVVVVRPMKHPQ